MGRSPFLCAGVKDANTPLELPELSRVVGTTDKAWLNSALPLTPWHTAHLAFRVDSSV